MNRLKKIKLLKEQAETLGLENREIIGKYNMRELCSIYNGIGPDAFPGWLREFISALHPSLEVVAFIHDIEWHESDGSQEKFHESNDRFLTNGRIAAKARFGWWHPQRYLVTGQARRFSRLCRLFGWKAWITPCSCVVCRKKYAQAGE